MHKTLRLNIHQLSTSESEQQTCREWRVALGQQGSSRHQTNYPLIEIVFPEQCSWNWFLRGTARRHHPDSEPPERLSFLIASSKKTIHKLLKRGVYSNFKLNIADHLPSYNLLWLHLAALRGWRKSSWNHPFRGSGNGVVTYPWEEYLMTLYHNKVWLASPPSFQ